MSETRSRWFTWPPRLSGPWERWWIVERLRQSRVRINIRLAVLLGINLLLLALYLWSRGGQTTRVTVDILGEEYAARIDGHQTARARLSGPTQGGIVLLLTDTEDVPSLPKPRGLDSIRITDAVSGDTLFEDEFTNGLGADWTVIGTPLVKDGVAGTRDDLRLALLDRDWTNYTVEATFRNFQTGAIIVRAEAPQTGVYYSFRPFRDYDNTFAIMTEGQLSQGELGTPMELDRTETVKALLSIVLHPYPYMLLFLAAAFGVVLALQVLAPFDLPRRITDLPDRLVFSTAIGLAIFGFIVTLFLNYSYGSHMPHVPDEIAYIFQAKLMATAHINAPLPPVEEAFDYFYPPFFIAINGHWAGIYPFGHPLILAVGAAFDAVWLIPPLVGALCIVLTYAIGRKVYSARIGLLAAFLFTASPFYLMTASNLMSHNTAAFYLLCSLACIAYGERRPVLLGVLGGISFGLFYNTQQLPAVALVAPFGLLLASDLIDQERRPTGKMFFLSFFAGGLLMLIAYFLFNNSTTGDPTTSVLSKTAGDVVGFGGERNSSAVGIQNQQTLMAYLVLVLNGWPLFVGLAFVLLPFMLGTRHRWDWFLLMAVVCALGVYVLVMVSRLMHGPRYWYPATPLLMLLSARGAERAGEVLSDLAQRARLAVSVLPSHAGPRWAGTLIVYVFIVALAATAGSNWLLGKNRTWTDPFVPGRAVELKGFNNIDDRLVKLVRNADLHNALVLVEGDCPEWQCYGSVFWLNDTTLDGDVVYARDVEERRAGLFQAYPDRLVYYARYTKPAYLSVYGSDRPLTAGATPPLAREIDLPTPTPTPTPDPAEASRRDDQRRRDLDAIAGALQEYRARHGAYPIADNIQSFCRYRELDAGCKAGEVLDPLPQDPGDKTYFYWSNGVSFYVFAETETLPGPSQCDTAPVKPLDVPAERLYCLYGSPVPGATPPPLPTPTPAP